MKTISLFILLSFGSCASPQYFTRIWKDTTTGQQMTSDTIVYVKPFGIFNPWAKESCVKYKMKWQNLVFGFALAPTVVAPVVAWGFYLFEADRIEGDKYDYVKVNPEML
jgi:hypothetical protein